jgi:release factor glutamine methyltransferase
VDLIVSNPPYVDAAEIEGLAPEVRDHEPRGALVPPSGDRYEAYRRLAPEARRLLRSGGWLLLEIGQGMDAEVQRLCAQARLVVEAVLSDLQSIPRTIVARYPETPHSP